MQINQIDDKQLIKLAIENKQEGFSRLLVKYKDRVQNYIEKFIGKSADAEDLMLLCFDKAFSRIATFNFDYAFSTWIYNIAQNVCIDHLRKNRQLFIPLEEIKESQASTPEDGIISGEKLEAFIKHINKLKPIYKDVALLRYIDDYAYEEIAKELDITVSTVKIRLHRAKECLSKSMAELVD